MGSEIREVDHYPPFVDGKVFEVWCDYGLVGVFLLRSAADEFVKSQSFVDCVSELVMTYLFGCDS